jgi:alpha-2-macroglobulin
MKLNLKSLSTRLLIIFLAMAALAFDRDDNTFEFHISTNRIYSPGEQGIGVDFSGRLNERTTLELRAFRVADPVAFFLAQNNPHSPGYNSEGDSTDAFDLRDARQFKQVAKWEHKVSMRDKYWQNDHINVPVKEKGVYIVQAGARGKVANTVLVVTELGMIVKQASSEALAFVTNRKSGLRVSDMPITFAHNPKKFVQSRTGADGVARAAVDGIMPAGGEMQEDWGWNGGNQLVAIGGKGDDFVISDSYFYHYYGRRGANAAVVYLHTDRPVYRPTQKVYYRGIVRSITDDGIYELMTNDTVRIEVRDTRGDIINRDTVSLSPFGTFSSELTLGDEPPLGDYTIGVTVNGTQQSFNFAVEEYKKPEYEVKVITDRGQYTRGDEIKAKVKADYYFGSPVASGDVQYQIYRARYWRPWWYRSDWAYLYEGNDEYSSMYGMQMVTTGEGKLDPDGTFAIAFKTDGGGEEDYVYRIQANVVDASRRSIAGITSVKVTRGELYVTANTSKYVYKPGDDARVNVETISFDGEKPVSAPFEVRVESHTWRNHKRGGDYDRKVIWKGSGSTDGNGQGSVSFPVKDAGYYSVAVVARDSRGTEISTSTSIYVADENYSAWYQGDNGSVQVIPDRAMYKPGETMSALVILPAQNADALITAEGSAIYSHQVTRLSSTSAIVRMPIEARHAPMFYVSASALAEDNFYTSTQRIVVAPEGKVIKVEVKTDRGVYKPGQQGKVTVRALDNHGEPVPNVDIALGMVDEAVYAIRPDQTPDIQKFFYGMRQNEVSTNTSLNFRFWAASRRTMNRDGLAVGTMAMAESAADQRGDFAAKSAPAPPPPPPAAGEALVQPVVRTDFRDLMFWNPSVRTDNRGYATVDVTFPDNLTTWRITARGVTLATAVGQATASVIARKDLLVRMETPRFITQGDELLIATTVHNYLSTPKRTKVEFSVDGVTLETREQTVEIPADGEKRIDWKITAPKIGRAKLLVKALTNEESDAMELTVPILPQGIRTGASAIADLDASTSSKTLSLVLPSNSTPESGEMSIALAPSAASSVLGALDELIGYPYGCVEQTMSRFLPTVVVADALKKIDVPFDETKRQELPKMVAKGLTRLYALQHDDGGWGWWEHDETNPFMTAYVMYGLTAAKRAGYDVNTDRYENGVRALRTLIEARRSGGGLGSKDKRLEATTEAYMVYVGSFITMGQADRLFADRTTALARRDDINNYGLALLTLAAAYQKDRGLADRLATKLAGNAEVTSASARWAGKSWHYNWQDDEVETSAFAVRALLETKGETDLVKKGIHYLLSRKKGNSWENTRQSAMVIYSLIDYIKSSRELEPDYQLTVKVNGREVFTKRMTKADIFAPEQQVKVDHALLRQGSNDVVIEKSGSGKLYASARLNYYATGPAINASEAGFKVTREYFVLRRTLRKGSYIFTKEPYKGTVKSGDELLVKVKIVPDSRYEYFMLEDPLPAGCEVVKTTEGYAIPGEQGFDDGENSRYHYRPWNWWYADRDVRDEKVAFFAPSIEAQPYEFSYIMRAQIPGSYSVMPAVGALMYYPEVRGNSNTLAMRITE